MTVPPIHSCYSEPWQGSSALASFYSLHGLFDTLQIFALVLNTVGTYHLEKLLTPCLSFPCRFSLWTGHW